MAKRIIYQTEDGGVAVVTPTSEALEHFTITEIADKDVPAGLPYKIVDDVSIPTDRTFRDAWEIDVTTLTDGVGSESNEFGGTL